MSEEEIETPEKVDGPVVHVDEAFVVDVDDPNFLEKPFDGPEVPPRELGEAHKILLNIYHPKDDDEQYVVHVTTPDGEEVYGTLFSSIDNVGYNFGQFIEYHIKAEDI